ncbi:MAG: hypothetical protein IKI64_00355 [Clostridia bacterium]|nr:hypothetical protein [Clostridia bacterium]
MLFTNDYALLKLLCLCVIEVTRNWTGKCKDCAKIHAQLEDFFGDRMLL